MTRVYNDDPFRIVHAFVCTTCEIGPYLGSGLVRHFITTHGVDLPPKGMYEIRSYAAVQVYNTPGVV